MARQGGKLSTISEGSEGRSTIFQNQTDHEESQQNVCVEELNIVREIRSEMDLLTNVAVNQAKKHLDKIIMKLVKKIKTPLTEEELQQLEVIKQGFLDEIHDILIERIANICDKEEIQGALTEIDMISEQLTHDPDLIDILNPIYTVAQDKLLPIKSSADDALRLLEEQSVEKEKKIKEDESQAKSLFDDVQRTLVNSNTIKFYSLPKDQE